MNPPVISPENSYIDPTEEVGRSAFLPLHVTQNMTWDLHMQPYASPIRCHPPIHRQDLKGSTP